VSIQSIAKVCVALCTLVCVVNVHVCVLCVVCCFNRYACYICSIHTLVDHTERVKSISEDDHFYHIVPLHCTWLGVCVCVCVCVCMCVHTNNHQHSHYRHQSLTLSLSLMIESFAYPGQFNHRLQYSSTYNTAVTYNHHTTFNAVRGILVGTAAVYLGLVAMIYQLGGFHSVLLWRGQTTYEFIVSEQKRQRELEAIRVQAKKDKDNNNKANGSTVAADRLAAAAAAAAGGSQSAAHKYRVSQRDDDEVAAGDQTAGEVELHARRVSLTNIQVAENDREPPEGTAGSTALSGSADEEAPAAV
jgi:hypothetical protein